MHWCSIRPTVCLSVCLSMCLFIQFRSIRPEQAVKEASILVEIFSITCGPEPHFQAKRSKVKFMQVGWIKYELMPVCWQRVLLTIGCPADMLTLGFNSVTMGFSQFPLYNKLLVEFPQCIKTCGHIWAQHVKVQSTQSRVSWRPFCCSSYMLNL